jgi:hypothetical protein
MVIAEDSPRLHPASHTNPVHHYRPGPRERLDGSEALTYAWATYQAFIRYLVVFAFPETPIPDVPHFGKYSAPHGVSLSIGYESST